MGSQLTKSIPHAAGCYLMKDDKGAILYIGKAKNLRKRVASYWRSSDQKTRALVGEIADIETIVTSNEVEALILEAQLIVQHHPKYNIDLQSPGRYAFLKITDEEYPRIVIARKRTRDGRFIGPFPSAGARNAALKQANRIFRLCKDPSLKSTAKHGCFRYRLGQCSGSCIKAISAEEYRETVRRAERFLKGDISGVVSDLSAQMRAAVSRQNFEYAAILRDQLFALQKLQEQHVSHPKMFDQDVVNAIMDANSLTIQIFHFDKGIISGRKEYTFSPSHLAVSTLGEALGEFLTQFYATHPIPREIIVPCKISDASVIETYLSTRSSHGVDIVVPQRGLKKKLLALVKNNLLSRYGKNGGRLYELQQALHLESLPQRIACIDISTLGGTQTVGSLVTFLNGEPAKSGYRKFIIKTVEGINDFAAMEEVVGRYARRIADKKESLPDVLVIDGGRGQLNSALKALAHTGVRIPSIGLAKRLEEVYVSWAQIPLRLHPTNPALQLLRAIRDEAHRFAVSFQRKRRTKRI